MKLKKPSFEFLVIFISCSIVVGGCGACLYQNRPIEGEVVGREFTPAGSSVYIQYIHDGKGNIIGMYPVTYYWPDTYQLKIRSSTGREKWVGVSKEVYATVKDGAFFKEAR